MGADACACVIERAAAAHTRFARRRPAHGCRGALALRSLQPHQPGRASTRFSAVSGYSWGSHLEEGETTAADAHKRAGSCHAQGYAIGHESPEPLQHAPPPARPVRAHGKHVKRRHVWSACVARTRCGASGAHARAARCDQFVGINAKHGVQHAPSQSPPLPRLSRRPPRIAAAITHEQGVCWRGSGGRSKGWRPRAFRARCTGPS